jgi:GNAT superfamily N-acetyltransferase
LPSLLPLLEAAAADLLHDFVLRLQERRPNLGAAVLPIGLAAACYAGPGSPLSTVKGLGPRLSEADLRLLEDFFSAREAQPTLEIAPWMDADSLALLKAHGYAVVGEEDVMLRSTSGQIQTAEAERLEDCETWAAIVSEVFAGEVRPEWVDLGVALASIDGAVNLGVRVDGEVAAVGQLIPGLRVATLACDATREPYRQRGLQTQLILARLGVAAELGLLWATSEVAPGSGSQRNYERCGFTKAYTRQHWRKE